MVRRVLPPLPVMMILAEELRRATRRRESISSTHETVKAAESARSPSRDKLSSSASPSRPSAA
ncbi:MAG: hypothetical protein ACRDJF_00345 [Actinomycetota bacterium]